MLIYTSNAIKDDLEQVKRLGMGIMVASCKTFAPRKEFKEVPCAMDNGAFQCWRKGFPFQADVFRATMAKAYEVGLTMDFIVCPDVVGNGAVSLPFSMGWALGEMITAPRLALAIQDGMLPREVNHSHAAIFSHLFVGGTVAWKWRNAESWVDRAHELGMKAHIGQVGTLPRLIRSREIGADSVDSSSFVRNKSWHIVEEYLGGTQGEIFARPQKKESTVSGNHDNGKHNFQRPQKGGGDG